MSQPTRIRCEKRKSANITFAPGNPETKTRINNGETTLQNNASTTMKTTAGKARDAYVRAAFPLVRYAPRLAILGGVVVFLCRVLSQPIPIKCEKVDLGNIVGLRTENIRGSEECEREKGLQIFKRKKERNGTMSL